MADDDKLTQLARRVDALFDQVCKNSQTLQELEVADADTTAELVEQFDLVNSEIRAIKGHLKI